MKTFNEPIQAGWAKSGSRTCFAKLRKPDCEKTPPPPELRLPSPTYNNPKGPEITAAPLKKCWRKVGDWMFEPGAESLCKLYANGDSISISKNLTQFDGQHCWSTYYKFAYFCEYKAALEAVLTNLNLPSNTTSDVKLDVPKIDNNSPGYNITDPELRQCWRILGDRIFLPGNEFLCYEIDFGNAIEPLQPPPLHLPIPTFKDPRGTKLINPREIKCYKKVGDFMFLAGNEKLCEKYDNGNNVVLDPTLTQFDGKHCFTHFYNFAYRCENLESLLNAGFPMLTSNITAPTLPKISTPVFSPISMGHKLTDPDLKQCWLVLGDLIYEEENSLICYQINFGVGMTPIKPLK